MNVRFFAGSKKQYIGLTKHDRTALYFCYDTRELFWGDLLLSDGMRVVASYAALPAVTEAADGVIYFVTDTRNGYVLSNDRTEWIQVIQAPNNGSASVFDPDSYFTKDETIAAIGSAIAELNIPSTEGLATKEYVDKAIAALPKPEEIDLTGYATTQWVIDQGYLTSHIDISGKADIDHKHDDLYDVKGAAEAVKNEILNGAGSAYDTLKELSDLIADNKDALEALETIATDKADKEHTHEQYLTEHQSLEGYAKKEELFSGSYNDLSDKPDIPNIDGLASKDYVDSAISAIPEVDLTGVATETFVQSELAKIELPDVSSFITEEEIDAKGFLTEHQALSEYAKKSEIPQPEIFVIDFNTPDFAAALEAYKTGKLLLLTNVAPDVTSYAVMNYVRDDIITFTKFLMSRSGTYGSFNTYYLHSNNTWELAKEVKLNKVEANVGEDSTSDLKTITVGKETYRLDGYVTTETVNQITQSIENIHNTFVTNETLEQNYITQEEIASAYVTNTAVTEIVTNKVTTVVGEQIESKITEVIEQKIEDGDLVANADAINYDTW